MVSETKFGFKNFVLYYQSLRPQSIGKLKVTKKSISENFNMTKISATITGRRLDVGNLILLRQSDDRLLYLISNTSLSDENIAYELYI